MLQSYIFTGGKGNLFDNQGVPLNNLAPMKICPGLERVQVT